MEIDKALTQIRKEKNLKIATLHRRICKIFGKKAISYRTLLRVLQGDTYGRESSLYQICLGLDITPEDIKTRMFGKSIDTRYLKRTLRKEYFVYNEKAMAYILSDRKRKISAIELTLNPKGATKIETNSSQKETMEMFCYIVRGRAVCHVGEKRHNMKKGDCINFDAAVPHHFENKTTKKAQCLIITNSV